jgi:hypothetical protein
MNIRVATQSFIKSLEKIGDVTPIKNIRYFIKDRIYDVQEFFTGVSHRRSWSLFDYLAKVNYIQLVQFKKDLNLHQGYPYGLTYKKWCKIINEMIWAYGYICAENGMFAGKKLQRLKVETGYIHLEKIMDIWHNGTTHWTEPCKDKEGFVEMKSKSTDVATRAWKKGMSISKKNNKRMEKGLSLYSKYFQNIWL